MSRGELLREWEEKAERELKYRQRFKRLQRTMMRWADKNKRAHLYGDYELTDRWKQDLKVVLVYERQKQLTAEAMRILNDLYNKYRS